MSQTPRKPKTKPPLTDKEKHKKQERINKALSKYTESPEYPNKLFERVHKDLQTATGAIYSLDDMISRVNVVLHQAQGPRTGKISVRFTKAGGSGATSQDRTPHAIVWHGGDGPTIYKKVDERLTRVKMHGLVINRMATRRLLNHLQILLDRRTHLVEKLAELSKSIKHFQPTIIKMSVATTILVDDVRRSLEVDFTKVQ